MRFPSICAVVVVIITGAGCSPLEEVQASEPRFVAQVPASWDKVGACLAAYYANGHNATYLPVPSENRATLIVKQVTAGLIPQDKTLFLFEIGPGSPTAVTVRGSKLYNFDRELKRDVDRCGKILADSIRSSPHVVFA